MLNGQGDFLQGIADMSVLSKIPVEHLDEHRFGESEILLIDSNIEAQTLKYILERAGIVKHVIYEPISKEKS